MKFCDLIWLKKYYIFSYPSCNRIIYACPRYLAIHRVLYDSCLLIRNIYRYFVKYRTQTICFVFYLISVCSEIFVKHRLNWFVFIKNYDIHELSGVGVLK